MTDMKFNFRSTLGFVTDGVGETFFGGGAYSGGVGYGISSGPDNYADRDNALDRRLAGIIYMTNGFGDLEFRADIGNGTFNMRCAMGDAAGPHTDARLRFFDGANATPILTIGPGGATDWVDAAGTNHATAAAWVSSNASVPLTITGGYVRVILGNSTGDYTALAHVSFVAAGGGGSKLLLQLQQTA